MQRERLYQLVIFIAFLIIYIFSRSEIFAISHDSVSYINEMKGSYWIFHPHHLLYHDLNKLLIKLISSLTSGYFAPHEIMSTLNSVFGALTLSSLYGIFRNRGLSELSSIFAISIVGFNFGFWHYSSVVEVYIIPIFFLVLTLKNLQYDIPKINKVALYAGLATLFHQSYIFLLPIIIIVLLAKKNKVSTIVKSSMIYCLIVGIPYLYVSFVIFEHRSIAELFEWLTYYSHKLPEHWNSFNPLKLLLKDIIGITRSIVSTQFLLTNDFVVNQINSFIPGKSLTEESYMLRNMGIFSFVVVCANTFIIALFYLKVVIEYFKTLLKKSRLKSYLFESLFILIFGLFFTFWSSDNPEFWISINLMVTVIYFSLNKNKLLLKSMIIVSLLLQNYLGFFNYVGDINNDLYYAEVKRLESTVSKESTILTNGDYKILEYLDYYGYDKSYSFEDTTFKFTDDSYYLKLESYKDNFEEYHKVEMKEIKENIFKIEINN